MFERRIKILLGVLAGFTLLLMMRAGWLQIVQGSDYDRKAADAGRRPTYLETFRGRILDYKDRVVAEDAPCIDAAVDYRAIDIDAKESQEWLTNAARKRLLDRGVLKGDRKDRERLIEGEIERVKADLQSMWVTMARLSNQKLDDIEEIKESIKRRVRLRQRYVNYRKFEAAKARHENEKPAPAPAWYKWLGEDTPNAGPQVDSFNILVAEQTETHAILHAIDNDTYVALDKLRERCPGLELKKGIRRNYPFQDIACHVIGQLSPVTREDMEKDPNRDKDESRRYSINAYIGRSGIERLAEQMLRGTRGMQLRTAGSDAIRESIPSKPGDDVKITLDMDLQMRIQEAFMRYEETGDKEGHDLRAKQMRFHEMHGAAVVIDVATGQVRAMVSYPTYNLNQFDSLYPQLVLDAKNLPLLNRATQVALEPGSTVKPMVGLSAITAGVAPPDVTIECTGYLVIDGRVHREGRCWVASKFGKILGESNVAHHPIPSKAPHPTGFLTFADALERSCNVFFETLADRLKMDGLHHWMGEFGLGRYTEIGIMESKGRIPGDVAVPNWRSATWFSGIGQSQVLATPIQMANVAATIARRGVWVRPHLIASESPDVERRDLHLNQQALDEAVEGMINVVTGPAGTGPIKVPPGLQVAGKTGTAQAARFTILQLDDKGKPFRKDDGKWAREYFEPSTPEVPNHDMPWYRGSGNSGTDLGHAWFIGFAPAHNPTLAFAVMVEYGGAGGKDAGPVATAILEACVEHGYLSTSVK
jgi:penicillin-binding protein 2